MGAAVVGLLPMIRYFFNANRRVCRDFAFYGQAKDIHSDANNFATQAECEQLCGE